MATSAPRQGFLARLLPASGGGVFFELFEQHAERTREAAELLVGMFRDDAPAERQAERVKSVEHQGDEITHTVIERLHQTFITPIDRDEIHQLITRMDDILDLMEDVSQCMFLYDIKSVTEEARTLADICLRSTQRVSARLEVEFQTGAEVMKEWTDNLSRGGIFVRTDAPPEHRVARERELHSGWNPCSP